MQIRCWEETRRSMKLLESLEVREGATETVEGVCVLLADASWSGWLQVCMRCVVEWSEGKRVERRRRFHTANAFVTF